MTTRPKKAEQNLIADARLVASATRRNLDDILRADARREEKLLTVERLARFESRIEALAAIADGGIAGLALQAQATVSEASRRELLFQLLSDVRAEINVTYKRNRAIRRAFGGGFKLKQNSTPSLLQLGTAVLNAWKDPEMRQAAERAGIDEARIQRIEEQVAALATADTGQGTAVNQGRIRTLSKQQLLREVRSETSYLREVAGVVFRRNDLVLKEFASTQPRRAPKPRPDSSGPSKGDEGQKMPPERPSQDAKAEKVASPEGVAQG
ncbi:MAG TPA: hypothetical protein VH877_17690 [Polyangia bacterium]|jgi:hypothetical protein|nr:hypothetical protein [Polyangia bacterium]